MKFGGTSVEDATAIDRVAEIVKSRLAVRPFVVVSAMAMVTDQLLAMAAAAGRGERDPALEICRQLRERHYLTAGELLGTGLHTELHSELGAEFDSLDELLRGIAAVGELTPRTSDYVVSFGERLSSMIATPAFLARGIPAKLVDARQVIVTDAQHSRAVPQVEEINDRLQDRVKPLIARGCVPIMGGFVGATREGVVTTIGRGGSDFSAALVGAGLNAERIEIWTDVDGMKTTDPRICPDARRIKVISFEEAAELAYFGAKVLHPATVLPAVEKNIPVLVLNSRNPANEGTRILSRTPRSRSLFKAIAAKSRITVIEIVAARMLMAHGFLAKVFEIFARHRCAVDVVSTSEVSISLTVDSNEAIPQIAADLEKLAFVKYSGRKAIVCLVGENIRETAGVAAQVFDAIRDINVQMISQGASEINLTFVINEADVPQAVRRLHAKFFADVDPEVFD
ncbi:MAG: lysine-sensitive aspartokinase 3 [Acidobacteriota bacterium]|nr:lysine-sensitive aspartokinase 3 [Acidobacteriota bacterium]